eukprot:1233877-Rhodomonas_salina.4
MHQHAEGDELERLHLEGQFDVNVCQRHCRLLLKDSRSSNNHNKVRKMQSHCMIYGYLEISNTHPHHGLHSEDAFDDLLCALESRALSAFLLELVDCAAALVRICLVDSDDRLAILERRVDLTLKVGGEGGPEGGSQNRRAKGRERKRGEGVMEDASVSGWVSGSLPGSWQSGSSLRKQHTICQFRTSQIMRVGRYRSVHTDIPWPRGTTE